MNFYINLLNLLNRFDGGIGTNMRKAAHPLGGMGSSNPRRWRGERLQHHGDVIVMLFVLFVRFLTPYLSVVLVVHTF